MAKDLKTISSDLREIQLEALKAAENISRLKKELAALIQQRVSKGVPGGVPTSEAALSAAERYLERGPGRFRVGAGFRATFGNEAELRRLSAEIAAAERVFAAKVNQLNASLGTFISSTRGLERAAFPALPSGTRGNIPFLPPGTRPGQPPLNILPPGTTPITLGGPQIPPSARRSIEEEIAARTAFLESLRASRAAAREAKGRGRPPQPPYTVGSLENLLGVTTAQNLLSRAAEAGFSVENIKRVKIFNDNYKQVLFSMQAGNRTFREAQFVVDKYGNILTSTQKQFRTFVDAIRRNIVEMIKWSAATLVVWGSIRKISDLLRIAIDNETQLASIGIVLGKSQGALARVFENAAEAAYLTGENLGGVLEGYAQAYRAAGNVANETERAAVAQNLLINSLILSRLSALNQSEAMDTLIGALRQSGLALDQGGTLLDSWVRVSRYASVSIDTLAESFAIVAGAANSAGVDMHKLNGIVATLAEATTLSATEAGNAVRAFISGFSSDQAVKELGKFGIAVVDSTNQTRGFLEILTEISNLYQTGLISDDQLRAIARAIGGQGARREAQVVTVIKNLGRANEIAAISAEANGDAMQALSIQLETVQTSLNRLSNAFQVLARTIGAEGGVLSVVQLILSVFEKLVLVTADLTRGLGELTPALAGVAAVLFLTTQNTRIGFLANLSNYFTRANFGGSIYAREYLGAAALSTTTGGFLGNIAGRLAGPGIAGRGTLGGQIGAAAFLGYSLFQDIKNQDWSGVGGSIAGGIAGFLVGGPVGSILGTAIGETLANVIFNYKPKFENFFQDVFKTATEETAPVTERLTSEEITNKVFETFGRQRGLFGGIIPGGAGIGQYVAKVDTAFYNFMYEAQRRLGRYGPGAPRASITPEQYALASIKDESTRRELLRLIRAPEARRGFAAAPEVSTIVREQSELAREYYDILDEIINKEKERYTSAALAGKITDRDLKNALDLLPNLSSILTKYEVSFGEAFRELNSGVSSTADTFSAFANLVINSSPEQIEALNAIAYEIATISNLIETAQRIGQDYVVVRPDDPTTLEENEALIYNIADAQELLNDKIKEGALYATNLFSSYKRGLVTLPSIVTLDIQSADLQKVMERALQLQGEYISKTFEEGLNQGLTIEDITSTFEPIMIRAGKEGGYVYAEGFMSQFLSAAVDQLRESGELLAPPGPLGLRTFDIPSTQFPAVLARYQQLVSTIQAQVPEWKPDEETFAALFTDYIAMPITADLTLLNIAMQELIDVNKKQLDGIYNLPTDASFYVPFTGYQLGFVNRGGGGGGLAGALAAAKEAADTATEKIAEQYARERIIEKLTREGRPTRQPNIFEQFDYGRRVEREYQVTPYPPYTSPGSRKRIDEFQAPLQATAAFQPGGMQSFIDVMRMIGEVIGNSLKNLGASLNLQIETKTQLIVDGRQLAEVIKPYLTSDEVRFEGTGGGAVKRFVF